MRHNTQRSDQNWVCYSLSFGAEMAQKAPGGWYRASKTGQSPEMSGASASGTPSHHWVILAQLCLQWGMDPSSTVTTVLDGSPCQHQVMIVCTDVAIKAHNPKCYDWSSRDQEESQGEQGHCWVLVQGKQSKAQQSGLETSYIKWLSRSRVQLNLSGDKRSKLCLQGACKHNGSSETIVRKH